MLHLHFKGEAGHEATLGPAESFRIAGNFIRDAESGEILARYLNHFWHVGEKSFTHYECPERPFMRVAVLLRPQDANVKTSLASALASANQHTEAISHYEEAIKLKPGFYLPHYNLGNTWTHLERPADAERCFQEAIRLNPKFVPAYLNLASSLANRKQYAAAEVEYRKAREINPLEPRAHLWLGDVLMRDNKRLDEVEASFREAIRLAPQLDTAHLHLAQCLSRQGKLDDAEEEFRIALRLAPKTSANLNGLANVLFQQADGLAKQAKWTEAEAKLHESPARAIEALSPREFP